MHKKILNQKALRLTSFFDDETDTSPHFWDPALLPKDHKDWTPSAGQFFFKKSKKKVGENKRIYMCLFKNYLITSKNKEWSKKYKSLDLSKNFVTLRKLVDPNGSFRFGFSLTYNTKQIEIYAKDSDEMNTFIYQLKRYVVQTDFDEKLVMKDKLGNGSYAEVYKLEDKLTRSKYAGKIFNLSALPLKNVQTSKRAIKNEAVIQRQMEHENITKLYEIYESENRIVLVMEYVQGKRLLDYVVEHAPISEKKSIMLIKQLIEGVIYIHDHGFIHRDIKLENAMILEDLANTENKLTIKILDFGLAVEDGQTEFLKKSGTPGYVAPEVFLTEKYDNKIDVFSLGVILFTMLAGRSPFVGPDRRTVLSLNRKCEFSFRTRHWQNKSTNCKDLVRRMMEADPTRRPDARKVLDHPWFKLVYLNGVQPLINIPKIMTVSNAYIFAAGRIPSQVISSHQYIIFPITKKKSASETTFADTKAGTGRRKSTIDSNNSSVKYDSKGKRLTFTSHLLQIPIKVQTPSHFNSNIREASREELEVSSIEDGINRGSLRSFYKNNSSSNYESRSGSELSPTGRKTPVIVKSNTLDDEIAMENPDIKDKISSYKGLDASLQPSSNMNWSRNLPSLVQIPEMKEEKLSFEVTNESLQFVKAQIPRSQIQFKALSPYLKSNQELSPLLKSKQEMSPLFKSKQKVK